MLVSGCLTNMLNRLKWPIQKLLIIPAFPNSFLLQYSQAHRLTLPITQLLKPNTKESPLVLPCSSGSASSNNSISKKQQCFHFSPHPFTNLQAQTLQITPRVQLISLDLFFSLSNSFCSQQRNVLKINVGSNPSLTSSHHMHGHDLQGLHWSLPTSYLLSQATLAYYLFLKYASSVLICSLFLVYSGHRSLHGSFTSYISQIKYFLPRHFLINQSKEVTYSHAPAITMLLYFFFHGSYILFTYLFTEKYYPQSKDPKDVTCNTNI